MLDLQVVITTSHFLILSSLFHITIDCHTIEDYRFTCYRQNMNCFAAFSISILDILPNRFCSKVSLRFQILFFNKVCTMWHYFTRSVRIFSPVPFLQKRESMWRSCHPRELLWIRFSFNQLTSIYETRNEGETIVNETLLHLTSDGQDNMWGGAPPAPLNYKWQYLFEINSRILRYYFV